MKTNKESPWVEKYRPTHYSQIKSQEVAVQKIKQFIDNFAFKKNDQLSIQKLIKSKGRNPKRSIILHGPPGTGKTTLAHVAAQETDAEIFELNASDLRNKGKLREILKPAMEQRSLVSENKIILVDEVDGISKVDWGGLPELLALSQTSIYPMIITANDIWDKRFSALRQKSEVVQLKEIPYSSIKDILIKILQKENMFIPNEVLTKIAQKSKGDLRAAINDLQAASKLEDPSDIVLDERNKEMDIFNALRLIFKGEATNETLRIFDNVKESLDQILLWIEENIPAEYSGIELAYAIDKMSKADIFKGRIYKQQYWRFLVYENIFLSFGISAAKKKAKTGFTSYKKPTRILKIWLNNRRTEKKKSICTKYAAYVHVGLKRAMNEFPVIKNILMNIDVQKELKLSDDEIEYLKTH